MKTSSAKSKNARTKSLSRRRGTRPKRTHKALIQPIYSYSRNQPGRVDSHIALSFLAIPTTATAPAEIIVRKNQSDVGQDFSDRFKKAVQLLVDQGNYSRIVGIHANMDHRMHSMNGPVGTRRFLPWHRIYLIKFEAELRIVDPTLSVPYWDWTTDRAVPKWMEDFTPTGIMDLNGNPLTVQRFPGSIPGLMLPDKKTLNDVRTQTTYLGFTRALEQAHNTVHNWVGGDDGIMSNIMYSPADPVFWLHHAFIDKVFYEWQSVHPNEAPNLEGSARVMDPWSETLDDAMKVAGVGYRYE